MDTANIIRALCRQKGISVTSLEEELGFSNGSLTKGVQIRSDRLLLVARRLGVSMEYLLTGETESSDGKKYYISEDAARAAQEIFENKEMRALFDIARDADPEDLIALQNMALALKRKERKEHGAP